MNTIVQKMISFSLLASLVTACVPKKFDIGIPKDISLNLSANTESKFKFLAEELKNGNLIKTGESLADYSIKEIGNAILKSEEIIKVAGLIELKENVECYSDTNDYLQFIKTKENNYNYHLSIICFSTKNLPNTDNITDSEQLSLMMNAVYAFIEGNVTWSKSELLVTTKNSEQPDVSIKPMPLLAYKLAKTNLLRILLAGK